MKIKIALICSENISEARGLSVKLQNAMEVGEMRTVDQTTEKLLSLTDKIHSLSMSEENWHRLIRQLRDIDGHFKSDYIIDKLHFDEIRVAGLAVSYADIVSMIDYALKNESVILQLPYEEDDNDV